MKSYMSRLAQRLLRTSAVITSVAFVGIAIYENSKVFSSYFYVDDDDDDPKKKEKNQALVIPFHRLNIVEQHQRSIRDRIMDLVEGSSSSSSNPTKAMTIELRQLIDVLHYAASDPNITAIYGVFGHGGSARTTQLGWAQLEEIRNALQVFKESHRQHLEPNIDHDITRTALMVPLRTPKSLIAYSDTFESPSKPSNPEYYLASVFTNIIMQEKGTVNLFGTISQGYFVRDFLRRYNIQLHVFKHGNYKNSPNMFTDMSYNKYHYENVVRIQKAIEDDVRIDITLSRSNQFIDSKWFQSVQQTGTTKGSKNKNYPIIGDTSIITKANITGVTKLWNRINDVGSYHSNDTIQFGFIDSLSNVDPLYDWIKTKKKGKTKWQKESEEREKKFDEWMDEMTSDTDTTVSSDLTSDAPPVATPTTSPTPPLFTNANMNDTSKMLALDSTISLRQYLKQVDKLKTTMSRKQYYQNYFEKSPVLQQFLTMIYNSCYSLPSGTDSLTGNVHKEHIALVHLNGTIGDQTGTTVVDALRKIRKENSRTAAQKGTNKTKCIILRINTGGGSIGPCINIQEELKVLQQQYNIPVIVSFGDVSASGGYYVSSFADRIFGSKKTITGSIGVFGIRPDLSGLAAKYGVNVDHIASSDLAGIYQPFYPMSNKMKQHITATIDRYYSGFKEIVASGRSLSPEHVESIAQGRVFTGIHAKQNGLIDEIGGLHRAIAYARRTYTSNNGMAYNTLSFDVIEYPKNRSLFEQFIDSNRNDDGNVDYYTALFNFMFYMMGRQHQQQNSTIDVPLIATSLPGIYMVADENTAVRCCFNDLKNISNLPLDLPPIVGMGSNEAFQFPDQFWR